MITQRNGSDRPQPNVRTVLLALNGAFWLYFWLAFMVASQPNDQRFCMDGCLDPYVIWGRAIGLGTNPLIYPFMKAIVYVQLPSFSIATLVQNAFAGASGRRLLVGVLGEAGSGLFGGPPSWLGGRLFLGISVNGYRLFFTMLLSFIQWLLIARGIAWLAQRFVRRPVPAS